MKSCEKCGVIDAELTAVADGTMVCDECLSADYTMCDDCGEWHESDEMTAVDDYERRVCNECLDNYTTCDHCGDWYRADDMVRDEYHEYCERCFDQNYVRCENCGEIVNDYDSMSDGWGNTYCEDCYSNRHGNVHDYSYKPSPAFFGNSSNKLYYGLELEIDDGRNEHDCADELMDGRDDIYLKNDGSLDDGFEIVTHPATLNYHTKVMMWDEICQTALKHGYKSHDTDTCGLHIHASRDGLGETETDQDLVIAKLMLIFDRNWDNIVKFTRRDYDSLHEWAKKLDSKIEPDDDTDSAIMKSKVGSYDRYRAINLTNRHTIEFRVFRGTLKPSTIIASIQFVDTLIDICKQTSLANMARLSWSSMFDGTQYKELKEYMNERNLNNKGE